MRHTRTSMLAIGSEEADVPVDSRGPPMWSKWWVLFLTCVMSAMQCAQWALPGPIAGSLQTLYGLDSTTIQLLLNYGPIVFLVTSIPYALSMRASAAGLRLAIVVGIACTAVSALLRLGCRGSGPASMVALHLSFVINAAAGPPAMACVTQLTELWFAPNERATATAIAVEANVVGAALAFIAGPLLVPQDAPADEPVPSAHDAAPADPGATP